MNKRMSGLMSLLESEREVARNEWRYEGSGILDWQEILGNIDNTINSMWSKEEVMIAREEIEKKYNLK